MANDLVIKGLSGRLSEGLQGQLSSQLHIATGMDLRFKSGTVTLLLGRSGTGKTMLLEQLSGLREASVGEIKLGDLPLWMGASTRQKPNRQVLLRMGSAFQHPEQQLFADTIRGEFAYTLRPYKLSADEFQHRIGLGLRLFPGDASDWLERDPFSLSGGQQRRLSLALLEAAAPEWLLLDEPTAGIDQEGTALVCQQLHKRKEQGLGTLVATHDPEAFIALADHVLILYADTFWHGTPGELAEQPQIWSVAGLALPASLETLITLRRAGFDVPKGWPDAAATAAAIVASTAVAKAAQRGLAALAQQARASEQQAHESKQTQPFLTASKSAPHPSRQADKPLISRLKQRDPRAIWLMYMLISPGILLQSQWMGWIASFIVMLCVIRYAQIPLKECLKPAVGLIIFTLLASILAGLTTQAADYPAPYTGLTGAVWELPWGIFFVVGPAVDTFFLFSLLVMIMLIGFVLLSGINHLRLKRAIEQGLQPLQQIRVPVDQFALAASLIIRFLPMIMEEWQRFARIAAARGKYPFRPGQIPIFRLRMVMIPILVSLLRLGEWLSLILIVRGMGQAGHKPTIAYRLLFNRKDGLLVAASAIILLILMLIHYMT
ncbi:ATP-binding cassette domain-containing protein [Paenibacillus agricola]|uniref:ATP-binding cassette domain-containing protein n=1 Tax=Paenibacillus agricola TaxID=2716264 RepID=A0ABX0J6J7_9BACL|nr:ATP-binding cassette domain-containing protein [Paenibacillus agricola]NHN31030.1 ATP-binding cassette domain-containing protein [Paenibacillus agricola]